MMLRHVKLHFAQAFSDLPGWFIRHGLTSRFAMDYFRSNSNKNINNEAYTFVLNLSGAHRQPDNCDLNHVFILNAL